MTVIEFYTQAMLVIRWRRWLTDHFVSRWLATHNHYRISLVAGQTDNPDQRIAEDVYRFINGGSDGSSQAFGIYDFSILLISTISTLVSFAILLWGLSRSFTLPGTDIVVPGFLFWVALIYAASGTLITHLIGRPLVGLYFERQHREADFRFSLARLREYSEQVALLNGEQAEATMVGRGFTALIANYIDLIRRRMRVTAFTQLFGQLSPIIPYVFSAPYYFLGKIELGTMTQTANAFGRVSESLTFFVNYYTYLAGFKSVVDRLNSFDAAIDQARAAQRRRRDARSGAGRQRRTSRSRTSSSRCRTAAASSRPSTWRSPPRESVALTGPSGSGKSTLFRAIAGIWPFGGGHVRAPERASVMVVPPKPYIPISTLRAAVDLPGGVRDLCGRGDPPGAGRFPSRQPRRPARPRGGVVAAPVERRAAAPRHRARPAQAARLAVSRRVRPRRSRRSSRPSSTPCWRGGCPTRRSCRSATAPRWSGCTGATSRWCRRASASRCATPPRPRRRSEAATSSHLSMIFSENRCPLFGIMLYCGLRSASLAAAAIAS